MILADAELIAIIEPVARRLLGEPNRKVSTKTELRFGTRGSMSVDLAKGTFFDHEIGQGGGVLDLIERETGKKGKDRFQWIVDAGLAVDEHKPSGRGKGNGHDRQEAGLGRIVAAYQYVNEAGALLFEVVRFQPKDFRQRRPDPTGRDGWNWKTKGVRQVPYRLPELIEAIGLGKPVFVVEGERDADRLMALDVPATTNAMGAGCWKPELNGFFAGARVVVIPDHDPQSTHKKTGAPMFHDDGRPVLPGQDHAEAVARHLCGVAARVQVLDLAEAWPAIPPHGDVSDWFDQGGGTVEALYALAENASVRLPDAKRPPRGGSDNDDDNVVDLDNARTKRKAKPPPAPPPGGWPEWVGRLRRDDRGRVIPDLDNVLIALRGEERLAGAITFDEMRQHSLVAKAWPHVPDGKPGERTRRMKPVMTTSPDCNNGCNAWAFPGSGGRSSAKPSKWSRTKIAFTRCENSSTPSFGMASFGLTAGCSSISAPRPRTTPPSNTLRRSVRCS